MLVSRVDGTGTVLQTSTFEYTVIPFLALGAIVLAILFLLFLVILVLRGPQVSRATGGAVTLALASMVFLTGVWCSVFSPTSDRYESMANAGITLPTRGNWTYVGAFTQGETITGNVNLRDRVPLYEPRTGSQPEIIGAHPDLNTTLPDGTIIVPKPMPLFSVYLYDPQGGLVYSEERVSSSYFTVKASRTGQYRFIVENESEEGAGLYVSISKTIRFRPLEPVGQWLSLVSLPLIGLGIWATLPRGQSLGEFAKNQRVA